MSLIKTYEENAIALEAVASTATGYVVGWDALGVKFNAPVRAVGILHATVFETLAEAQAAPQVINGLGERATVQDRKTALLNAAAGNRDCIKMLRELVG